MFQQLDAMKLGGNSVNDVAALFKVLSTAISAGIQDLDVSNVQYNSYSMCSLSVLQVCVSVHYYTVHMHLHTYVHTVPKAGLCVCTYIPMYVTKYSRTVCVCTYLTKYNRTVCVCTYIPNYVSIVGLCMYVLV